MSVRALLVRVGADGTDVGGRWNAPVDRVSRAFAYVPITEPEPVLRRHATPLDRWASAVERLGSALPDRLRGVQAHADPDFGHLTNGDRRERGRQIREKLGPGDALVFYAGLRDTREGRLVYALIGLLTVEGRFTVVASPHWLGAPPVASPMRRTRGSASTSAAKLPAAENVARPMRRETERVRERRPITSSNAP